MAASNIAEGGRQYFTREGVCDDEDGASTQVVAPLSAGQRIFIEQSGKFSPERIADWRKGRGSL